VAATFREARRVDLKRGAEGGESTHGEDLLLSEGARVAVATTSGSGSSPIEFELEDVTGGCGGGERVSKGAQIALGRRLG
jgi:hypothetical protein